MAGDLDRAGRCSGGPAGRAGVIQAGRESCRTGGTPPGSWGPFAGPDGSCRTGALLLIREEVPAGLENILSFFVILLSVFDDLSYM